MLPELLTIKDVALWLRTTEKAVHHMRERGQLPPPIKIGRRLLWDKEKLASWLEEVR